jgi:hypothetical protein
MLSVSLGPKIILSESTALSQIESTFLYFIIKQGCYQSYQKLLNYTERIDLSNTD